MPDAENKFLKPTEHLRDLRVLEEISKDSSISQRKLSQKLGIALGMTNACIKKMIQKGLVKARGINHKRIAYYLTPQGLAEKTTLTYHFLQHTIGYYTVFKNSISDKLCSISRAGFKRIICYGAGEVMEIASIILNDTDLELQVVGIVDDDQNKHGKKMFGFVIQHPKVIKDLNPNGVLVTSIRCRDQIMQNLNSDGMLSGVNFYSLY